MLTLTSYALMAINTLRKRGEHITFTSRDVAEEMRKMNIPKRNHDMIASASQACRNQRIIGNIDFCVSEDGKRYIYGFIKDKAVPTMSFLDNDRAAHIQTVPDQTLVSEAKDIKTQIDKLMPKVNKLATTVHNLYDGLNKASLAINEVLQ